MCESSVEVRDLAKSETGVVEDLVNEGMDSVEPV